MAKGSKRNKERAAAQAKKRARVEKRKAAEPKASPKKKPAPKAPTAPKSRPSGNQSGLTTAQIKEKRKLKGIGQFADDKGKDKGKSSKPKSSKPKSSKPKSSKPKSSKPKTQPNVIGDLTPKQRDQKIFQRVLGEGGTLTNKIKSYQDAYGGESKESKKYLQALKDSALERMKVNPGRYDRSNKSTPYAELSMAEQYDKNTDKLMNDLKKPLTSYIDNPGDTKGLNMFDSNRELKFDSAKLKSFASSDIASALRTKARGLGVSNTAADRTTKTLEGIGKVKNKKSSDLKSKFAQDLKFIV